jgi:23S rRNA (uracil1939-C5)-methyltransferase
LEFLRERKTEFDTATVWDLYGGFGALGFAVVNDGARLVVVEQSPFSQTTFDQLAGFHPNVKAKYTRSEVLRALPSIAPKMHANDVVILDPPRSGCHPDVLTHLGRSVVNKLVYVSCNPARLARDLKILASSGFRPTVVQPVDFFPQTPEIEVLVFAER